MSGLIGKKIGMTSVFETYKDVNTQTACTMIELGPCVVTQVKTVESDGYSAVQISFGDKREKNTSKPMQGHFEKAKTAPKYKVLEIKTFEEDKYQVGDVIKMEDIFEEGDFVNVVGTTKGKGFQGVVKRHNFGGVGQSTHGQHNRQRAPGSIGAASYPSRVFKGLRMAGRTGNKKVVKENLRVLKLFPEKNLILVSGSVPGAPNSFLVIKK